MGASPGGGEEVRCVAQVTRWIDQLTRDATCQGTRRDTSMRIYEYEDELRQGRARDTAAGFGLRSSEDAATGYANGPHQDAQHPPIARRDQQDGLGLQREDLAAVAEDVVLR